MFQDVSILFMLYKIGEVFDNQNRTNGFEKKRKNKRFTVCCACCRQNPKTLVISRCCFDEYEREMPYKNACRTCSMIISSSFRACLIYKRRASPVRRAGPVKGMKCLYGRFQPGLPG